MNEEIDGIVVGPSRVEGQGRPSAEARVNVDTEPPIG